MILTAMGKGGSGGALYPDAVGRRALFVGSGAGPTLTSNTTGDAVSLAIPSYYVDAILAGASTDGTYFVQAVPNGIGPRATWSLFYYLVSGPTAPSNGVNLSSKTFVISAIVGQF